MAESKLYNVDYISSQRISGNWVRNTDFINSSAIWDGTEWIPFKSGAATFDVSLFITWI